MLIFAFEVLTSLVILAVGWSQLVVPLWRGTPLVPWLRPPRQLEGTLREAREQVEAAAMAAEIQREKDRAARMRKDTEES